MQLVAIFPFISCRYNLKHIFKRRGAKKYLRSLSNNLSAALMQEVPLELTAKEEKIHLETPYNEFCQKNYMDEFLLLFNDLQ